MTLHGKITWLFQGFPDQIWQDFTGLLQYIGVIILFESLVLRKSFQVRWYFEISNKNYQNNSVYTKPNPGSQDWL